MGLMLGERFPEARPLRQILNGSSVVVVRCAWLRHGINSTRILFS